jgi:hypothetical protein
MVTSQKLNVNPPGSAMRAGRRPRLNCWMVAATGRFVALEFDSMKPRVRSFALISLEASE